MFACGAGHVGARSPVTADISMILPVPRLDWLGRFRHPTLLLSHHTIAPHDSSRQSEHVMLRHLRGRCTTCLDTARTSVSCSGEFYRRLLHDEDIVNSQCFYYCRTHRLWTKEQSCVAFGLEMIVGEFITYLLSLLKFMRLGS